MTSMNITEAKEKYLNSIKIQRRLNTFRAYTNALDTFINMLKAQQIDVSTFPVAKLNEDFIVDFVIHAQKLSPSSESLYLQVIKDFSSS